MALCCSQSHVLAELRGAVGGWPVKLASEDLGDIIENVARALTGSLRYTARRLCLA